MADEKKTFLMMSLESRQRAARDLIVREARSIALSLTRLANALEKDPETPINSLGEIQGRGPIFDARCSEYATLCNVIEEMNKLEEPL